MVWLVGGVLNRDGPELKPLSVWLIQGPEGPCSFWEEQGQQ